MKRFKIISILLIIALLIGLTTFFITNNAIALNRPEKVEMFNDEPVTLLLDSSETRLYGQTDVTKGIPSKIDIYTDKKNNRYEYNENQQLVTYISNDFLNLDATNVLNQENNKINLSKNQISEHLAALFEKSVDNYSSFTIKEISNDPSDAPLGGYQIWMERKISNGIFDEISISMNDNGTINWAVFNYANISTLTEDQEENFNQQFLKHIESSEHVFDNYDYEVSYRKIGDKILAVYSVIYYISKSENQPANSFGELISLTVDV